MARDYPCCPFCFHSENKQHKTEHSDNDYWTVVCLNCGAEGPLSATEHGARKLWNTRSERHVFAIEYEGDPGGKVDCICGESE